MHAYFSATNVAPSASVCHLAFMATKLCALATITGRPRKEDQNALSFLGLYYYLSWSKWSFVLFLKSVVPYIYIYIIADYYC
ncbi:hypothetical protein LguiB_010194 [Lonicera macranthoides]